MNPKQTIKLATTELPSEIQSEVDELRTVGVCTKNSLEELERAGKILKKNAGISTEVRTAGNALFKTKGHDSKIHSDILSHYSKSIAFAPVGSEELILGYSNRSILLMHLHRYEESLVDIDRAMQLSNSDDYKKKLQTRKEKCLELINDEKLSSSAKNLTLGDNEDFIENENLEHLASKMMNFKPSDTIPCASDSVGLAYNDIFGRHLVATRDIEPGEILIVEEGQVCYPALTQIYLVCSHCLQIAWNGIPCDECVYAIYCSETCKNEAFSEYHDIECPMLKYMDCTVFNNEKNGFDRMAIMRLLIRAVKREGFESIMQEVFKKEKEENLDVLLTDGILQSDKFKSFYNLLPHATEFEKAESKDYEFHTLQMVYFLMEHTDFLSIGQSLEDNNTLEPTLLLKLKQVLLKLKYITVVNGFWFQTTPYQCGCKNLNKCNEECNLGRGVVIVPCCSLLNHSCTPNVSHSFAPKRKVIVFSTSPIKKGEQLCDSYGISFLNGDLKVREETFKGLHFTCQCKACLDRIDSSMVPTVGKETWMKVLTEFKESFPDNMRNSFFLKSNENCEMTEAVLKYALKMSQLYYKYFNYYEAFQHSIKCKSYIEQMVSYLYEEKSAIPKDC